MVVLCEKRRENCCKFSRSLFSFFVSVLARREEGAFQVFLPPKDSHKFIPLSPSCRERKKDKKGQRQTQRRRRSLFLRVGQTKKRTKKQEGKKDRISPPPKRDYTYPKVRYYIIGTNHHHGRSRAQRRGNDDCSRGE